MIQPCPRDLCEKLVKMGCRSESGFYWEVFPTLREKLIYSPVVGLNDRELKQAFFQNDFTGATEQARENARIVWPTSIDVDAWVTNRWQMIDYTEGPWWKMLEETMVKKELEGNSQ